MALDFNFHAETSQAALLKDPPVHARLVGTPIDPVAVVQTVVNEAQPDGSAPLTVHALELYLIQAVRTVDFGQGPIEVVGNPPEFLYVADIGLAAKAGIRLFWNDDQGHGDPAFLTFRRPRSEALQGLMTKIISIPRSPARFSSA